MFSHFLEGNDKELFSSAWEGISYFSNYLNKDVADTLAPIYLKAVEHLNWLKGQTRHSFIDLYVLVLLYVAENPCSEYIPKFYNIANEEDRKIFLKCIEHRLAKSEDALKTSWWNSWLKQYLVNRFLNKPKELMESEKIIVLSWLPELYPVFEEAVDIVCRNSLPKRANNTFLFRLDENKLIEKYPGSTIRLITMLLDNGTTFDYQGDYICKFYKAARGLSDSVKRAYKEAALKRGIYL